MKMLKFVAAIIAAVALPCLAWAQTAPSLTFGEVLTPAQWSALFAGKQDFLGSPPILTTGGTLTGELFTAPSTTSQSGLNIPPGVAPTSPVNGDFWSTSVGFFGRVNGATVGPFTQGTSGSFTATSPIVPSFPGGGVVNYACPTCGVTGSPLSQFASTTSAQLAGIISDETGSGPLVFGTAPTIGSPVITGGIFLSNRLSPQTISGTTNDYDPTTTNSTLFTTVPITCSGGNQNITGLANGVAGHIVRFENVGPTNTCTLLHQNAGSFAANRFALNNDITINPVVGAFAIIYDGVNNVWRPWGGELSNTGVSTSPCGDATHVCATQFGLDGRATSAVPVAISLPFSALTGSLSLGQIAAGTQDTALGYWASTAVSANAIPNCSNALIYSTATHLFGCNVSGGTGTVTQVVCNGVTITTVGTCPPIFGIVNHGLSVSASAGALTINLTDSAGNTPSAASPVNLYHRNATGNVGSWTQLTVTSALSLTIPSGATLNFTSATAGRLWMVLFDDGGTPRLGATNCLTSSLGVFSLNENIPSMSTAISTGSNSSGVFYTGTAVGGGTTAEPYGIVGFIEWGPSGLTAGTWTTTNIARVQSFGPGIRKPGEQVQNFPASTTTGATFTNTASMAVISGVLNAQIAPTSAANPIRISASGTLEGSANMQIFIQLSRGSTAIGVPYSNSNSASANSWSLPLRATDLPNTISLITYQFQGKVSSGTASWPAGSNGGLSPNPGAEILLEEIMGANDNDKFGLPQLATAA